jgi:hypothetical protein
MSPVCKKETVAKGNHTQYVKQYIMTMITQCDIKMSDS